MCSHADNSAQIIAHLTDEVYADISQEINAVGETLFVEKNGKYSAAIRAIFSALKSEIQSLVIYDTRLVFPSVLKVFSKAPNTGVQPNVAELQTLTKIKAHRIGALCAELETLCETENSPSPKIRFQKIITLLKDDFAGGRRLWDAMIDERLNTCACFRKNAFSPKNKNLHS